MVFQERQVYWEAIYWRRLCCLADPSPLPSGCADEYPSSFASSPNASPVSSSDHAASKRHGETEPTPLPIKKSLTLATDNVRMAKNLTSHQLTLDEPRVLQALVRHIVEHADLVGYDAVRRPVLRFEFACEHWLLDELAALEAPDEDIEDDDPAEQDDPAEDIDAVLA